MALTPLRWIGLAVCGALVLAAVGIRPEPSMRPHLMDQVLESRSQHAGLTARTIATRLRLEQIVDSVRRVVAQPTAAPVRVFRDASLDAPMQRALDAFSAEALSPVAARGAIGIDLVYVADHQAYIDRASTGSYGVTTSYLLPRGPRDRCVVIVRIGDNPSVRRTLASVLWREAASREVIGPCGFYRAFGMPGAEVDRWLRSGGWAFANAVTWDTPVPDPPYVWGLQYWRLGNWYASGPYGVGLPTFACMSGRAAMCEQGFLDRTRRPTPVLAGGKMFRPFDRVGTGYRDDGRALGPSEEYLLSDMVRDVGQSNFEKFWTSSEPVPVAFARASTKSLGAWLRAWTTKRYGTRSTGPGMSGTTLFIAVALFALGIIVSLRVSTEREYR